MFVDASAIIAIIGDEDDALSLAARLGQASKTYVSPMAVYEAVAGPARKRLPHRGCRSTGRSVCRRDTGSNHSHHRSHRPNSNWCL
ncbi:PIN domain-containing protein (plasmid) [Devosia sp. A8/3-2]|nr:PIN domain-containing protein [Devosia sp. A8/3-2]